MWKVCAVLDESQPPGDNLGILSRMPMAAITVRVSDETADRLDQLAHKLDQSQAMMAEQTIEDFVERQEWQIAEIEAGLAEADRGEFATDEEVANVLAKYLKPRCSLTAFIGPNAP
jgi:predicted transcriptional regulator